MKLEDNLRNWDITIRLNITVLVKSRFGWWKMNQQLMFDECVIWYRIDDVLSGTELMSVLFGAELMMCYLVQN